MNPYEATLTNVLARVRAWLRGVARRYRKPLMLAVLATATIAASVNTGRAAATNDTPPVAASR